MAATTSSATTGGELAFRLRELRNSSKKASSSMLNREVSLSNESSSRMLQAQMLIQQSKDGLRKVHEGVTSLATDLSKARHVAARLVTGHTRAPVSAPIDVPASSAPEKANYGAGDSERYGSF